METDLAAAEVETDGMNSYYSKEMKKQRVPASSSHPLSTVLGARPKERKQTQIADPVTPMQQIQYCHSYSQQDLRTQMDMIVRT